MDDAAKEQTVQRSFTAIHRLSPDEQTFKIARARSHLAALFSAGSLAIAAPAANAVDGCLVLLCLAAPSWRAIPQCVPPIRQVLRDLARGRGFPHCAMSGPANSANHQWSSAPANCPPQYTRVVEMKSGTVYSCAYAGAVAVNIEGTAWSRTWWNIGGDTVTQYFPAARAQLGTWDTKFDDDYAAWLASLPASTSCATC